MKYTTLQEKLKMPEYGRNIQQMVEYAVQIPDRNERTRCVMSVINTMGNMFPYLRDVNDFKHKLWDHVMIMSDFKLDIDFPCEIIQAENLYTRPNKVPYKSSQIHYQHYGRTLEDMIEKAAELQPGAEREELIMLIANQMKKCFLTWNKEIVDDSKIFDDLRELSYGRIDISKNFLKLIESRNVLHGSKRSKRKK